MVVLPKVRSALCAASQLPGERPTDVEDAPAPACYSKHDDDEEEDDSQDPTIMSIYTMDHPD